MLIIHIDGGSRGNPGPAGAGVTIHDERGRRLHESAHFFSRLTNNEAEYQALLHALRRAARFEPPAVRIRSDSELLVRQITGEYRIKSPRLAPLVHEAQKLLLRLPRWSIEHIAREWNQRADELANLAMDRAANVLVFDVDDMAADTAAPAAAGPDPAASRDRLRGGRTEQPSETPAAAPADSDPHPAHGPVHVRVNVIRAPSADACPAGGLAAETLRIGAQLPAGLCVHAAHALLPTILAVQAADPGEAVTIPTMTVRCTRNGCDAMFHVVAEPSTNGRNGPPAASG